VSEILWRPSPDLAAGSNMARFLAAVNEAHGLDLGGFKDLHRFSVTEKEKFWTTFVRFAGVQAETWGPRVLVDGDKLPGAKWFPDARLNFAQNLLRRGGGGDAIVFRGENGARRSVSRAELTAGAARLARAMAAMGIRAGDRVGGYLPNVPEAVIAMLAAASLGAIWSSCSPDFGVRGVLDRFGQIEPKLLFAADGYFYGGKEFDCLDRLREIRDNLPSVERTVVVPFLGPAPDISRIPGAVLWDEFADSGAGGAAEIEFAQLPFDHPLYILYSSGTTGAPKCIVHGAGGTLLQHLKEHLLHFDVRPGDRTFYFTTCGWMMWNWLATMLASQAALLLYDGSPFYPDANALFDFAETESMTHFGCSAKFLDAAAKAAVAPARTHDLSALRVLASTGSPLAPEGFDYVYRSIKPDVHLVSHSGGTDIIACFVGGHPLGPVRRGEIQGPMLAMAVDVFGEDGKPLAEGKGDLVCTETHPSLPLGFWNDPQGGKYFDAYFSKYPGVWHHGDYVEWTPSGGMVIYGRSDATLNPGGVRIGTAEIYRQVERLDEVLESIVIGQDWDGDTRVVLFVVLREGLTLDDGLTAKIKAHIRANATPRHVPARVIQVTDIPRTKSGKITELAVRDVVHGRPVKNREALANPEALVQYADMSELRS